MISISEIYKLIEKHEVIIKKDEKIKAPKLARCFYCDIKGRSWINNRKEKYKLTDWALYQLCTKLNFSTQSYTNLTIRLPKKAQQIIRKLLSISEKTFLLRSGRKKSDGIRAVLSEHYSRYQNRQMMDLIMRETPSNLQIAEAYIDDLIFEIKVLLQKFKVTGEEWYTGFRFLNSEVGWSRIRMDFMLYRLGCSNGLIVQEKEYREIVKQIHMRIREEKLERIVKQGFKSCIEYTDKSRRKFEREYDKKLSQLTQRMLKKRLNRVLTFQEMAAIEARMHKYRHNYIGYANAVAEIVHVYMFKDEKMVKVSYSRKKYLEELAGRVIFWGAQNL